MTAARQERKSSQLWCAVAAILGAMAGFAGSGPGPASLQAAITERLVANRYTGLAIDGFDPVAYFVDAEPRFGRADLEFRHAGATWRFVNAGNRAAFVADPEVYMPRFGGYDAIAVARGVATPGHPKLWQIADQRLYLFYSEEARSTFIQNPEGAIEAADRHWPEVLLTLSP